MAVYEDEKKTIFKDTKEFKGSILQQIHDAFEYIDTWNRTSARIVGLERKQRQEYPKDAVWEAWINALVHRDYGFSGSVIINANATGIEFISLGGLMEDLSIEDITNGISQPRNPELAGVFHQLHMAESYGTGLRRIMTAYSDCDIQPQIETTENTFKLSLPNRNIGHNDISSSVSSGRVVPADHEKVLSWMSEGY